MEDAAYINEENRSERVHCIILVDSSDSMNKRGKLDSLNQGMQSLKNALVEDTRAENLIRIMIIAFGGPNNFDGCTVLQNWTDGVDYEPPTIPRGVGLTPLGHALEVALAKLNEERSALESRGLTWRPRAWLYIITDGLATDDGNWGSDSPDMLSRGVERVHFEQRASRLNVFPFGVDNADFAQLRRIDLKGRAFRLTTSDFKDFFTFISKSVSAISRSSSGEKAEITFSNSIVIEC